MLVEVPRSSFYEKRDRPLSDHDVDDAWLANDIFDIHVASRCTYGRRVSPVSSTIVDEIMAASG